MGDNRSAIFADDSNSGRIDEGVAGRQTIGHFEQQRQPSTPSFFLLFVTEPDAATAAGTAAESEWTVHCTRVLNSTWAGGLFIWVARFK